jgi:hypothetical protein
MPFVLPGHQPSQAQIRNMKMLDLMQNTFKGEDQYVMMTPKNQKEAIKILGCEHAAQVLVDGLGRLATEDEIEAFSLENKMAKQKVQKELDRYDLSKAVKRTLKD